MVSVERIREYDDISQEIPQDELYDAKHQSSITEWTTLEATSLLNSKRIDETISNKDVCDTESCETSNGQLKPIQDNYKGYSLSFVNVTCRYPGTNYIPYSEAVTLREVTFSLSAGQKIGVVGRTGAGKSSLVLALYRLLEQVEGEICFDGVDINTLQLERHRSRITIIPQV